MSDAAARVSLDASGYTSGADRIKGADREMAQSAKTTSDAIATNSERSVRSYREMASAAEQAYRRQTAAAEQAAAREKTLVDESIRYQSRLREMNQSGRPSRLTISANAAAEEAAAARREYARYQNRQVVQDSRRQVSTYNVTGNSNREGGAGGEGGHREFNAFLAQQELGHVVRSSTDALAAGASPLRVAEMELPRVLQAFGSGLGPAVIGVGALGLGAAKLVASLREGVAEARNLREAVGNSTTGENGIVGASAGNLQSALKAATQAQLQTEDAQRSGFQHFINQTVGGGTNMNDVVNAQANRARVESAINNRSGRELGIQEREFNGDETGAAREKAALDYETRRNEISRQIAAREITDGETARALNEREYQLDLARIARREASNQNTIDAETRILNVQREGKNVEVEVARIREQQAQAAVQAGPAFGPQAEENRRRAFAAGTDRVNAERQHDYQQADLDTRIANANLRGNPEQVARQQAINERDRLQTRLNDPRVRGDEQKQLEAQLAEARARLATLNRSQQSQASEFERLGIEAGARRGPGGRVETIDRLLSLNADDQKRNTRENGSGTTAEAMGAARLTADAAQLKREKEDIRFAEEQTLEAAKGHTREMQLQTGGYTTLAKLEANRLSYQQQIAAAIRDGKNDLAAQLQIQSDIVTKQIQMQAFLNPGQAQAERNGQALQRRRENQFDAAGGLINLVRDASGNAIGGFDPLTGQNRYLTPAERATSREASKRSAYDDSTKAREALGNSRDPYANFIKEDRAPGPPKKEETSTDKLIGRMDKLTTTMAKIGEKLGVA